jgi:hypothetical protein
MILHPIIIALFPVVALYAHNIRGTELSQLGLPLGWILAATLILWALLKRLTADSHKAALLTSLGLFFFFSYGHAFELTHILLNPDRAASIDLLLLPAWTLLLGILSVWLYRTRAQLVIATKIVNIFSLALISLSCAKIGWYAINSGSAGMPSPAVATVSTFEDYEPGRLMATTQPDIYFIILDAYARADVLLDYYGYDNALLLSQLQERGFFVADKSVANYSQTCLSLGATLNMRHHDDLAAELGLDSVDLRPLTRRIHYNKVMALLRKGGYTINCFGTGYVPTEIRSADNFYAPAFVLDDFQSEIFNSTPIPVIQKTFNISTGRRRRILYTFNQLPIVAKEPGPKFVFAHILAPHEPFIFGPDGEIRHPNGRDRHSAGFDDKENYAKAYRDQLIYVNKRLIQTIDAVIRNSATPPVIILQSDHGPASQLDWNNPNDHALRERMAILNALHLPGLDPNILRADLTPINTFGVILNHYLGLKVEMQEDVSRFSAKAKPYQFITFHP